MSTVQLFCKAVVALLVPTPCHLGSSAKHVIEVTSLKGDADPLLCMLQYELKDEFWLGLSRDLTLKAGSSKELGPKLKDAVDRMARMLEQTKSEDQKVLSAQNLELLTQVLRQLPQFQDGLRQSATDRLQELFKDAVVLLTAEVVALKSIKDEIQDVVGPLQSFITDLEGTNFDLGEEILQLTQWQEKSKNAITRAALEQWLAEQMETSVDGASLDLEQLRYHTAQHPQGFPENMQSDLKKLYVPLMNRMVAVAEVAGQFLISVFLFVFVAWGPRPKE